MMSATQWWNPYALSSIVTTVLTDRCTVRCKKLAHNAMGLQRRQPPK